MNTLHHHAPVVAAVRPVTSFGDYVRQQHDDENQDPHLRALELYERAARHQRESVRLLLQGDARQAQLHASLARKHAQTALSIEQQFSAASFAC